MAKVYSGERVFLTPILAPVERFFYRAIGTSTERGQDWKSYARSVLVFSALSWLLLYLILRTQGIQPFNPEGFGSAPWDVTLQHHLLVRHQHELAVLRRRDDALLLLPDGRPRRPELPLRGRRDGRPRRGHPRDRQPRRPRARQLLGRPDPLAPLHPAAALDRRRALPRLSGRRPDARRLPRRLDARRRAAGNRRRPRRLADRDQAARHQRRRLLQRQLLDAVREPDGAHELRRGCSSSS